MYISNFMSISLTLWNIFCYALLSWDITPTLHTVFNWISFSFLKSPMKHFTSSAFTVEATLTFPYHSPGYFSLSKYKSWVTSHFPAIPIGSSLTFLLCQSGHFSLSCYNSRVTSHFSTVTVGSILTISCHCRSRGQLTIFGKLWFYL